MTQSCLKVFVLTTLLFSFCVHPKYSQRYNLELHQQALYNPEIAIQNSQKLLINAKEFGNVNNQLVAQFYIIEALINSDKTNYIDEKIEQALNLAIKSNHLTFKTEFLRKKAYRLQIKGNYLEATKIANQALAIAKNTHDDRLISETLLTRAEIHMSVKNNDLALMDIEKAIVVFKEKGDLLNISASYNLLAITYQSMENFDKSIKFFTEALAVEGKDVSMNQVILQYNLGTAYEDKKDFENAIKHYEKSKNISKQINDSSIEVYINYSMAEIYLKKQSFAKAESLLTKVIQKFKLSDDSLMLFNTHALMSELKVNTGEFGQSLYHLDILEKKMKELKTSDSKLKYLDKKILYHVGLQEWNEAYELGLEVKKAILDDAHISKDKIVSEIEVKLNSQFDQEKLQLLQKQNEYQQQAIIQEKIKNKYLWGLIFLSFVMLVISYFAYLIQKKIKQQLYNNSITDYLTNVSNRRHIIDRLKILHEMSKSNDSLLSIVMIDLDYFKVVNDTYGHDVGNEVLIHFARVAQDVMDGIGEVARVGGEEWLILLPNINIDLLKSKMEELRKVYKLASNPKIPADCNLSFSSGVLTKSNAYKHHEEMLRDADLAMYQAKKQGRNQDVYI